MPMARPAMASPSNPDQTYTFGSLTETSPTTFDAEMEAGTYSVSGSDITFTPQKWTCQERTAPSYAAGFTLTSDSRRRRLRVGIGHVLQRLRVHERWNVRGHLHRERRVQVGVLPRRHRHRPRLRGSCRLQVAHGPSVRGRPPPYPSSSTFLRNSPTSANRPSRYRRTSPSIPRSSIAFVMHRSHASRIFTSTGTRP